MMLANARRLELAIVAAGLLVLLLCSRPPRSGSANVRIGPAEMARETTSPEDASNLTVPEGAKAAMHNSAETRHDDEPPPADVQPRMKRIGVVDARSNGNPKYKDLMYGEIAVRWIWNGHKLAPQKVCIVDEGNGVSSVWSFDQSNGVTVSERQEMIPTSR
jgi:hypothetical protein